MHTKDLLVSEGDYGCECLYFEGDLTINSDWLDDSFIEKLDAHFTDSEIGTIAIRCVCANSSSVSILFINVRYCLSFAKSLNCILTFIAQLAKANSKQNKINIY